MRIEYTGYSTSNTNFDKSALLRSHSWFKSVLNSTAAFTAYLAIQTGSIFVTAATEINDSSLFILKGTHHIPCVVEQMLPKKKNLIAQHTKLKIVSKLQLTAKNKELSISQVSLACYYPSLPSSSQQLSHIFF